MEYDQSAADDPSGIDFANPRKVFSWSDEVRLLERYINGLGRPISILEAGCGNHWSLKITKPYTLVGIDLDEAALKIREEEHGDLDRVIVGDVCTASLDATQFDVIYCSYVLEHIKGPTKALDNFVRWLKPGGLLLVRVPDRNSVFGAITRLTPHWVHVLFYRYVWGFKNAGKPGYGPYVTYHDPVISQEGIRAFCGSRELVLKEVAMVDTGFRRNPVVCFVTMFTWLLSLGHLSWRHNNLCIVVRKPDGFVLSARGPTSDAIAKARAAKG
jgi:SAM-dependent methyltransferase